MVVTESALARRATVVRATAILAMIVVAISQLAYIAGPSFGIVQLRAPAAYADLPPVAHVTLRAIAVLGWFGSFWFLDRAVRGLGREAAFSQRLTRNLRRFAGLLVVAVATPTFVAPLLGSLVGRCHAGGPCVRLLRFELRDILFLAVLVLFFFIAELLDQARRIEEDNAQIV